MGLDLRLRMSRENEIAKEIIDAAFKIHVGLGPGLLESVYETVLFGELRKRGLDCERQVAIPVRFEDEVFEEGFRADIVVENRVIVELKSVQDIHPVHPKILLTYLRLSNIRLGLLINFGVSRIKDGISRVVNGLPE
jgi:GxxExxY protein